MLVGFVLPMSQQLRDALATYMFQAHEKNTDERTRGNIRYAFNRLTQSISRGERRFLPTPQELGYLKVRDLR